MTIVAILVTNFIRGYVFTKVCIFLFIRFKMLVDYNFGSFKFDIIIIILNYLMTMGYC